MSLKKRLMAAGVVALVAALAFWNRKSGINVVTEQEAPVFTREKETLYLWYTDEALTSYISSAAVTYNETHDVRIMPVLEKGPEYLEKINEASLHGKCRICIFWVMIPWRNPILPGLPARWRRRRVSRWRKPT